MLFDKIEALKNITSYRKKVFFLIEFVSKIKFH